MKQPLTICIGSSSNKGVKPLNQDFVGNLIPTEPQLSSKGIVVAMADGISSSEVSQEASKVAVTSFIEDYYCTSESWSVKSSAQKVIKSINSWLFAQTQNSPYRFNRDKGYVCTFSAVIFKSNTAHIIHSGDTRVYRLSSNNLEQLTVDHRRVISEDTSYLTRALGIDQTFDVDYSSQLLELGDIYLLATDGVYEFISNNDIIASLESYETLQQASDSLIELALKNGSDDNLSLQIVRVDHVPDYQLDEIQQLTSLPLPPRLGPRMDFDGYTIIREIYISSRSHVFLAKDLTTEQTVVIKVPSTELRNDTKYLEHFMLEEWIAQRLNNPHIVKAIVPKRKRNFLYLVTEYIEGISLNQWMIDNPKPNLEQVRTIVEQVAKGLQAFHRQEMVHQDIRPNNIMIDASNTVKIIDFGSTFIAGVSDPAQEEMRGTMRYSAPEYFLGHLGTQRSDIYSLGVLTYQMLSGKFPYNVNIAQTRSLSAQQRLVYQTIIDDESESPLWIDHALQKALHVDPSKRYAVLSEFIYDLRHPNKAYTAKTKPPLIQRDPIMFWKVVSLILFILLIIQQL